MREIEQWSNAEIAEWGAYYELEPFGQERDNYHSAQVAMVTAQVNGNKVSISDFMYQDPVEVAERQVSEFFGRMDRYFSSEDMN